MFFKINKKIKVFYNEKVFPTTQGILRQSNIPYQIGNYTGEFEATVLGSQFERIRGSVTSLGIRYADTGEHNIDLLINDRSSGPFKEDLIGAFRAERFQIQWPCFAFKVELGVNLYILNEFSDDVDNSLIVTLTSVRNVMIADPDN